MLPQIKSVLFDRAAGTMPIEYGDCNLSMTTAI
jgi:hypothetical protein